MNRTGLRKSREPHRMFGCSALSSKNGLLGLGVLALLVVLPLVGAFTDFILTLLIEFCIYVILAQSWNLMGGYAGQINLGLAAYFGVGVLVYALLGSIGVPVYVSMIACGIAAAMIAAVIGGLTLPLKGVYFPVVTLAMAEVVFVLVSVIWTLPIYVSGAGWAVFSLDGAYFIALGLAVFSIGVCYLVVRSRLGFAAQTIRDNQNAAKSIGVNPAKYKTMIFLISAFLAGLAGGVFGFQRGTIIPYEQFATIWSFGPMLAACIGGLGTIRGPIYGCVIYVLLEELLTHTLGQAHLIVFGGIFILVMIFLPGGLVQGIGAVRRLLGGRRGAWGQRSRG